MELIYQYIVAAWNCIKGLFKPSNSKSQTKLIDNGMLENKSIFGSSTGNINIKDSNGDISNITTVGQVIQNTYKMGEEEAIDFINKIVGRNINILKKENEGFKETIKIIEKNFHEFQTILLDVIKHNADKIDKNKEYDPDVQSIINQALITGTRKGVKIDLNILAKLILEKLNVETNDILDSVVDTAMETVTKLNQLQIQFITLVFWMKDVKILIDDKNIFQQHFRILHTAINIPQITISNIGFLQTNGIIQFETFSFDIYKHFKKNYSFLPENESELDKEKYKNFIYFLDAYKKSTAGRVTLLPTGKLIAAMHLEKIFGKALDYRIWIN